MFWLGLGVGYNEDCYTLSRLRSHFPPALFLPSFVCGATHWGNPCLRATVRQPLLAAEVSILPPTELEPPVSFVRHTVSDASQCVRVSSHSSQRNRHLATATHVQGRLFACTIPSCSALPTSCLSTVPTDKTPPQPLAARRRKQSVPAESSARDRMLSFPSAFVLSCPVWTFVNGPADFDFLCSPELIRTTALRVGRAAWCGLVVLAAGLL